MARMLTFSKTTLLNSKRRFVAKTKLINQIGILSELNAIRVTRGNSEFPVYGKNFDKNPVRQIFEAKNGFTRKHVLTDLKFEKQVDNHYGSMGGSHVDDYIKNLNETNPDPVEIAGLIYRKLHRDLPIRSPYFVANIKYLKDKMVKNEFYDLNFYLLCKAIPDFKDFPSEIDKIFEQAFYILNINLENFGFETIVNEDSISISKSYKSFANRYILDCVKCKTNVSSINEYQTGLFKNICNPSWLMEAGSLENMPLYKNRNFRNIPLNYLAYQSLVITENFRKEGKVGEHKRHLLVKNIENLENLKVLQENSKRFFNHEKFKKTWVDFYFKLLIDEDIETDLTKSNILKNAQRLTKEAKYEMFQSLYEKDIDLVIDLPNICYMLTICENYFEKNIEITDKNKHYINDNNPKFSSKVAAEQKRSSIHTRVAVNQARFQTHEDFKVFKTYLASLRNLKIAFRNFSGLKYDSNTKFGKGYKILLKLLHNSNELTEIQQFAENESDDLTTLNVSIMNNCPFLTFDEYRDWDLWFQHYVSDRYKNETEYEKDFDENLLHFRYFTSFANILYYSVNKSFSEDPYLGGILKPPTNLMDYSIKDTRETILPNLPKPDLFLIDYEKLENSRGHEVNYTDALIFDFRKSNFFVKFQKTDSSFLVSEAEICNHNEIGVNRIYNQHKTLLVKKPTTLTTNQYYLDLKKEKIRIKEEAEEREFRKKEKEEIEEDKERKFIYKRAAELRLEGLNEEAEELLKGLSNSEQSEEPLGACKDVNERKYERMKQSTRPNFL